MQAGDRGFAWRLALPGAAAPGRAGSAGPRRVGRAAPGRQGRSLAVASWRRPCSGPSRWRRGCCLRSPGTGRR